MERGSTRQIMSDNQNYGNIGDGDNGNDCDAIIDYIVPAGTTMNESERKSCEQFIKMVLL